MSYDPYTRPSLTKFDDMIVAQSTQQFNLKSIYGISNIRDVSTITGSASASNNGGEYRLQTTASGADSIIFESAEIGRYIAGQDAVAGLGVRIGQAPTGNQVIQWGYFDDNNGFGYGYDATGLYVFRRKSGVDTKTYQSDWNADKLDGSGESQYVANPANGYIFQIDFAWYGYGSIDYQVAIFDDNNDQHMAVVHRTRVLGENSVQNPNLPIRVEIDNGGDATALDSVYLGGRQFSTRGKYDAHRRTTAEERLNLGSVTSAGYIPVMSMKRKASFNYASCKVSGLDISTNQDVIVVIYTNATLTGASFGVPTDYNDIETSLESDTSATALSGGEVIWKGFVNASGVGSSSSGSDTILLSDQDFIGVNPITVAVKAVDTTATVSVVLRTVEEW